MARAAADAMVENGAVILRSPSNQFASTPAHFGVFAEHLAAEFPQWSAAVLPWDSGHRHSLAPGEEACLEANHLYVCVGFLLVCQEWRPARPLLLLLLRLPRCTKFLSPMKACDSSVPRNHTHAQGCTNRLLTSRVCAERARRHQRRKRSA